jgi:hypothetical protein
MAEEGEIVESDEDTQQRPAKRPHHIFPDDLTASFVRQVEHYFSDENLAKDQFLR